MSKPKEQAVIEFLPILSLTIEDGFNIRSPKSLRQNAAELSALLDAHGGIDPSMHCVQYVERAGKKLVRGGHTLIAAAGLSGIKEVPAMCVDMDAIAEQVNLYTSNAGHPLTQMESGALFIRLRDGNTAEGKEAGEELRAPMAPKDIAARVGVTLTHVCNCIAIRESSPEIAALIESGAVSANVITKVNQQVKGNDMRLACIKAAIREAEKADKAIATMQHYDAIKAQFVEPKKLKAAPPAGQSSSPVPAPRAAVSADAPESEESHDSAPVATDALPEPEPEMTLTQDVAPIANPVIKPADAKTLHSYILAAVNSADDEFNCDLEEEQIVGIVEAVLKAVQLTIAPI